MRSRQMRALALAALTAAHTPACDAEAPPAESKDTSRFAIFASKTAQVPVIPAWTRHADARQPPPDSARCEQVSPSDLIYAPSRALAKQTTAYGGAHIRRRVRSDALHALCCADARRAANFAAASTFAFEDAKP